MGRCSQTSLAWLPFMQCRFMWCPSAHHTTYKRIAYIRSWPFLARNYLKYNQCMTSYLSNWQRLTENCFTSETKTQNQGFTDYSNFTISPKSLPSMPFGFSRFHYGIAAQISELTGTRKTDWSSKFGKPRFVLQKRPPSTPSAGRIMRVSFRPRFSKTEPNDPYAPGPHPLKKYSVKSMSWKNRLTNFWKLIGKDQQNTSLSTASASYLVCKTLSGLFLSALLLCNFLRKTSSFSRSFSISIYLISI